MPPPPTSSRPRSYRSASATPRERGRLSTTLACGLALLGTAAASWPASAAAPAPESFSLRSASDLVAICSVTPTDEASSASVGFCHGFVVGVYRTLEEVQAAQPGGRMFCPTGAVATRSDAIAAYVNWAGTRPDQLSKAPQDSFAAYLAATHPCPADERPAMPADRRRTP